MEAGAIYEGLIDGAQGTGHDPFDVHIAASIVALGASEAERERGSLCEEIGLDAGAAGRMIHVLFPGAERAMEPLLIDPELIVGAEEQSLRDILWMYATKASPLERDLAHMIARRCMRPHHLWQDLGLPNRRDLSQLMARHFCGLAERNRNDMKWKKFLYRMVCGSAGFSLCAAPVCSECSDFAACFGQEDGESLLARRGGPLMPAL